MPVILQHRDVTVLRLLLADQLDDLRPTALGETPELPGDTPSP